MNKKTENLTSILGARIKQARLNANISQSQLADKIGKSRTSIERAEVGKCNLSTFVSIIVALNLGDQVDLFLPEQPLSPVMLAKLKGKKRKRASRSKKNISQSKGELEW